MTARLIIGDARDAMATLPDGSVDLIVTSPPFLSLRSYLPADHPDKAREMGSEPTPGAFLDALLDVVEDCRRVLAPHGSLCIELGDTMSGSGGAGGDYLAGGLRDGQPAFTGSAAKVRNGRRNRAADVAAGILAPTSRPGPEGRDAMPGWPLDKSACAIPQLFYVALSYGLNPLTGRRTEPWRVRNFVAWCRPNPPVGADGDKFRRATSYITVATMARDRYWDGDAVRVPAQNYSPRNGAKLRAGIPGRADQVLAADENGHLIKSNPAGRPLYDWWELPTQRYPGAHYATYPEALVVPLVASMCPERVCRECGQPSRRIVSEAEYVGDDGSPRQIDAEWSAGRTLGADGWTPKKGHMQRLTRTTGWTDCGHNAYRPGMVLDPFAGSGTTLQVATRMGRDAIGIDLDGQNEALVRARVGLFLSDVEYLPATTEVPTEFAS